ncbi:Putative 115 kDa protein in type-1 retrotransposable element R1DM [Eumeta japonica]|uniref:115 kDa protein in type-1 retrotransposable element R1DM n=1 Tax=Eumeta variegata TaxID=151549 RepID=A0A4C1ZXT7_EUMVA|nr:Putative 115 kDa protein in type-1 retrotransposable element R1DM [Eumeta japonica]
MGTPPKVSIGERSRRESATADVRETLECHPVLEVSPALYTRLIKPATCMWVAAATGLGPVASSAVLALSWFRPYEADHASLRFIQSNLQRSKLATAELLVGASRRKIAVALVQEPYVGNTGELKRYPAVGSSNGWPRAGPVKAAILILDSDVDVEEDQTLIDENVTAAVVTAGNCRIGVVSVYFECDKPIGPYLDRVKWVCSKLGTNKIILGRRQRMERVVGSERDDARGTELCDFLDVEGLHVLNEGNIPTFEVYRGPSLAKYGGRDVQPALLDRAEECGPRTKARWSEFLTAFDNAKEERALTAGTVEVVDSCDRLDEVVDLYTECVKHACDTAIPRKRSMRRPKLPWWSPELEG